MEALMSFLLSAGGRLLFSYVADYFNKKQQHSQEVELLKLQGDLDEKRHARDMATIRLQSDLNVRQVEVAGDIDITKLREAGFFKAVEAADNAPLTGIPFIDGWNRSIRPGYATVALALWILKVVAQWASLDTSWLDGGQIMDSFDQNLLASIAGFYFANREIAKGNK